jgi:hypothetical protein
VICWLYVVTVADEQAIPEADQTAVRVALWRALHLEVDGQPPVLADPVGLQLADPADGWRERPDMDPGFTRGFRAAIVARARFIEDLVTAAADAGVGQYVLLGAGLDTFVERRPEYALRLRVFEIDQPAPQAWKRRRLTELGYGVPAWLRLVPVDFEAGASWWDLLAEAGFSPAAPAVVASTGVSMYLTREARAGDGGERGAGLGHAVHQLLLPRRDRRAGPRGGLRGRAARAGGGAQRPVLRRPGGRPADVDRRGPAGSDGLTQHGRVSLTP